MYIVKLPNGEYINLALICRVQVEVNEERSIAVIQWQGGGGQTYYRENAEAVIQAIDKLATPNVSDRAENIAREIFTTFNLDSSI